MCNQSNSLVDETFSETTQLRPTQQPLYQSIAFLNVFILSGVQWKNTDTDTNRKNV